MTDKNPQPKEPEVRNHRYEGATPEMVARALFRPVSKPSADETEKSDPTDHPAQSRT